MTMVEQHSDFEAMCSGRTEIKILQILDGSESTHHKANNKPLLS